MMEWSSSPPRSQEVARGSLGTTASLPFGFSNASHNASILHTPRQQTGGFNPEYNSVLQRMGELGLPTSVSAIVHEEPPIVSSSYLEAAGRLLNARQNQTVPFAQTYEERSNRLAGSFANVGSEQHPESVKDFVEKKRRENMTALTESEDSARLEAKRQQAYLMPDLEWEKFKEEAMLSYAAAGSGGVVDMLRNQRLRAMDPLNVGVRSLTNEERLFARALRDRNEDILCSRPVSFNLAEKFRSIVKSSYDKSAPQLWQVFAAVLPDALDHQGSPDVILAYRTSEVFSKDVVSSARSFLEKSAYTVAEERVRNPVRDLEYQSTDGSSAVIPYTRSQLSKTKIKIEFTGTKLHGLPIWALIFYSIRLGALKTAILFCNQGDDSTKNFVRFLNEYSRNDGTLLGSTQQELQTLYFSQSSSSAPDNIYKRAVIGILSCAEPEQDFGGITHSVSDWLWMKLAQTDWEASSKFSLADLQQTVRSRFPEGKTDDVEAYLAFVLTGQFELAVDRLFQNMRYRIHAVHMCIVLKHAKLLPISLNTLSGTILVPKPPVYLLDFASVIRIYVSEFRKNNVDVAMEYYYQLADTPAVRATKNDHEFRNLFEFCVYKLARETENYVELFGRLGTGITDPSSHGLVHKFVQNPKEIVSAVADDFVGEGRVEDAAVLYEIAGKRTAVFRTFLRALPDELMYPTSPARRKTLKDCAIGFAERFRSSGMQEDMVVRNFFVMLDLVTFFDLTDAQEDKKALVVVQRVKLVPLEGAMVESTLAVFKDDLLPEVRECIPHTVLRTMQALVNCYQLEKSLILESRVGGQIGASVKTANLAVSGAKLNDDLIKVQAAYRKQSRAILEFGNRIPSPQLPNLMDLLVKLECVIA